MAGKCIDFLTTAFKKWGSQLALIIIVCLLISLLWPSLNLVIFGSNPHQLDNENVDRVEVTEKTEKVLSGTFLLEETIRFGSSFSYDRGFVFNHKIDEYL